MDREPHPADIRGHCGRCGQMYYLADGCECADLTMDEIEAREEAAAEAAIDMYEESLRGSDYESDQAQTRWEADRTKDW